MLGLGSGGLSLVLTERTRAASFVLEVELSGARWICSKIKDFTCNPSSGPNFHSFRGMNALLSIQRFFNQRGSYLEISKLSKEASNL